MKKTPNLRYGMTGRRKKLWHIPRENQGLNEGSRLNCYTKPLVKKWADPLCFTMFTTGNFMNFVAQETDSYWFLYNSLQPPQKTHPKSTSRYLGSCERLDQVKGLGWSDDDDVEVLLKNLGRCFAKKKGEESKTSYSGYIYIYIYTQISSSICWGVPSLILNQNSPYVEGNKITSRSLAFDTSSDPNTQFMPYF